MLREIESCHLKRRLEGARFDAEMRYFTAGATAAASAHNAQALAAIRLVFAEILR